MRNESKLGLGEVPAMVRRAIREGLVGLDEIDRQGGLHADRQSLTRGVGNS
jgi:hypothetical protein